MYVNDRQKFTQFYKNLVLWHLSDWAMHCEFLTWAFRESQICLGSWTYDLDQLASANYQGRRTDSLKFHVLIRCLVVFVGEEYNTYFLNYTMVRGKAPSFWPVFVEINASRLFISYYLFFTYLLVRPRLNKCAHIVFRFQYIIKIFISTNIGDWASVIYTDRRTFPRL